MIVTACDFCGQPASGSSVTFKPHDKQVPGVHGHLCADCGLDVAMALNQIRESASNKLGDALRQAVAKDQVRLGIHGPRHDYARRIEAARAARRRA